MRHAASHCDEARARGLGPVCAARPFNRGRCNGRAVGAALLDHAPAPELAMRAALDLEGRHATHEGLRVLARLRVGRRHCHPGADAAGIELQCPAGHQRMHMQVPPQVLRPGVAPMPPSQRGLAANSVSVAAALRISVS